MLSFIQAMIALVVQDHPKMLSMQHRQESPNWKCYPPYGRGIQFIFSMASLASEVSGSFLVWFHLQTQRYA
nr:MAG TPA: hypothetical protein [Caudoviricetes sp.]